MQPGPTWLSRHDGRMTTSDQALRELQERLYALAETLPRESPQMALTASLAASMAHMETREARRLTLQLCMHLDGLYGGNALTTPQRRQTWQLRRLAGA